MGPSSTIEQGHNQREYYLALFESAYDAIFVINLAGQIVDANSAACEFVQYSREELMVMKAATFMPLDTIESASKFLRNSPNSGHISRTGHIIRKDGKYIPIEVRMSLFFHAGQQYQICIAQDITEHAESVVKALQQNKYLTSLHEITLGLLNRLDLNDLLKFTLTQACKLFGTPDGFISWVDKSHSKLEKSIGTGRYANLLGYTFQMGEGITGRVGQSGQLLIVEDYQNWPYRHSDPIFSTLQTGTSAPLKSGDKTLGVLGVDFFDLPRAFSPEEALLLSQFAELASIAIDNALLYTTTEQELSKRKQVEDALRRSEQKNRAIINAIPDTMALIAKNGQVLSIEGVHCADRKMKKLATSLPDNLAYYAAEAIDTNIVKVVEYQVALDGMVSHKEARIVACGKTEALTIIRDITERKAFEKKLNFLSMRDALTGLYNRGYFEEAMRQVGRLPYSSAGIIMCDIDGLKLINDTMGHHYGDELLIAAARAISAELPQYATAARVGGDEFAVLLPDVTVEAIKEKCRTIHENVIAYNTSHLELPLKISVGFAISDRQSFSELFIAADNDCYKEKLLHAQNNRKAIIAALKQALEPRDFITEGHADRLCSLATALAESAGIPAAGCSDLCLLAQFHDIGKVGIPDHILYKPASLSPEEYSAVRRHSEIGYRIAQFSPDLFPIADLILKHHERWDGSGYPLGLKAEEISLENRIFAIVDAYDVMTNDRPYRKAMDSSAAIVELRKGSNSQFDATLVEQFIVILQAK